MVSTPSNSGSRSESRTISRPGPPSREETAVVGARIGAQSVDFVATFVQLLVVWAVLGTLLGTPERALFLGVLTLPAYGGLLEGYNDGQTLGKMALGVRVVDDQGGSCSLAQAFVRNLPALPIGGLPYLIALASMAITDRRQRVFDLVAGTVVVRA